MRTFSYYFHHYWLPVVLVIGVILAGFAVYKTWDQIVIKGSGRK